MTNKSRVLYVGMTNDLGRRVAQHREGEDQLHFTARYRVYDLVYFEEYQTPRQAIDRETQIKAYRRRRRLP